VMERLRAAECEVVIYEPMLKGDDYDGFPLCKSLAELKESCDLIVANRFDPELEDVPQKVFTRDLFRAN
jgi:UDPglucose 6-dehydrogenase